MPTRRTLLMLSLFVAAAYPFALHAQATGGQEHVVVGIVEQFRQATASWPRLFTPYANALLLGLLTLEAYLSWGDWQTRQVGLERMVGEAVRKLAVIAVIWAFFTNPLLGPQQLVSLFRAIAGAVAGVSNADDLPGDLVLQGFSLADVLLRAAGQAMGHLVSAWWEISRSLVEQGAVEDGFLGIGVLVAQVHAARILAATVLVEALLSTFVVGIGVVVLEVGMAFVALQDVLIELDAVLLVAFAPLFAGFVSFRVTAGLSEAFLKQCLTLGLKLLFTLPLAAMGLRLADFWSSNLLASVTRRTLRPELAINGQPVRLVVDVAFMNPLTVILILISVCFYVYMVWSFAGRYASRVAELRLNLPSAVAGGGR